MNKIKNFFSIFVISTYAIFLLNHVTYSQNSLQDKEFALLTNLSPKTSQNATRVGLQNQNQNQKIRIGAEAGYAYRIASLPDGIDPVVEDYFKDLKSGFHWGLNAHYFTSEFLGFGVNYTSFYSSNASNEIATTFEDGTVEVGIKDEISIHLIAPSVVSRLRSQDGKHSLISRLSVGYMRYINEEQLGQRSFKTTGGTLGLEAKADYDFGLSEWFFIGVGISFSAGSISEVEVSENGGPMRTVNLEDESGERESLSRINITGGLRVLL